jgi:hypothetical protein
MSLEMGWDMSIGKAVAGVCALACALVIIGLAPAAASQSVDPCYRKCVMDRAWGNAKFACLRICNRKPVKQCQDRCFRSWPNHPRERNKCIKRC